MFLSLPRYSADGRIALVDITMSRGPKSAEQDLAMFELGAKWWKVTKAVVLAMAQARFLTRTLFPSLIGLI